MNTLSPWLTTFHSLTIQSNDCTEQEDLCPILEDVVIAMSPQSSELDSK